MNERQEVDFCSSMGHPFVLYMVFTKLSKNLKKFVKIDEYMIYLVANMQVKIRLIQFETKKKQI